MQWEDTMNLEVLEKSRKKIRPGDIFVFKPKGFDYYFGRVIRTDARSSSNVNDTFNAVLLYLYNATSKSKEKIPRLDKSKLLIPPQLTNFQGWRAGFFQNIASIELQDDDILDQHSFFCPISKDYWDEYGNQLDKPYEPVGVFGLASIKCAEFLVSRELGIPTMEWNKGR